MTDLTDDLTEAITEVAEDVQDAAEEFGDDYEWLGRVGWMAKGAVYALIGALFVKVGLHGGGDQVGEASQAGAIEQIAGTWGGQVLLVLLIGGLALYAVWRFLTVILPGGWTGRALLDRAGYAVSTGVYLSLLVTAVGFLRNRDQSVGDGEDRMLETMVKHALGIPLGRLGVAAVGLGLLVTGIVFVRKGIRRSFREAIDCDAGVEDTLIDHLGLVGWIARGVSMGLIGVFFVRAAWLAEPEEAAGLDDSVRQIASHPIGAALAVTVGVGFLAYGGFALVSARHQLLEGPNNGHHST